MKWHIAKKKEGTAETISPLLIEHRKFYQETACFLINLKAEGLKKSRLIKEAFEKNSANETASRRIVGRLFRRKKEKNYVEIVVSKINGRWPALFLCRTGASAWGRCAGSPYRRALRQTYRTDIWQSSFYPGYQRKGLFPPQAFQ